MNTLSKQLAQGPVLAPGVHDALSALAAEQAGFQALYLSGASIAYTRLGRSDVGLTTYSEVEDTLARIAERVRARIIVDADTGFGNALNVQRTVRGLERAGAAMIQLEDQTFPKRCVPGRQVRGAGRRDVRQAARRRGRAPITRDSDPGAYRRAGLGRAGRGAGTGRALSGSRRGRLVHRGPAQRLSRCGRPADASPAARRCWPTWSRAARRRCRARRSWPRWDSASSSFRVARRARWPTRWRATAACASTAARRPGATACWTSTA